MQRSRCCICHALSIAYAAGGQFDPLDPEFSVLKNHLQERMAADGVSDADVKGWDLSDMTKVCMRYA